MKRPAIFLDRDGTLVEEVNYLSRIEDLKLYSFTAEAVRILKMHGYLIVVVTNQSGIGRGKFSEAAMHEIHRSINRELSGAIDAFYFCPHLPEDYCECRKPATRMIRNAYEEHDIAKEGSWMIGDKSVDVEAGKNAGLSTILVRTGYGDTHADQGVQADYIEADLLAAARRIVGSGLPDKIS